MIPVLAVRNVAQAKRQLAALFGFIEGAGGHLALGDQQVAVCDAGAPPDRLAALPFDHLALSVEDADAAAEAFAARGGVLDAAYTPDGPAEIPEFWSKGVRFVFFKGPEGAPFEFCQKLGAEAPLGHSHFGLRTADLDALEARLASSGAARIARHVLPGPPPVEVRFLKRGAAVFELFDAPPIGDATPGTGWIGFIEPPSPR